MRHCLWILSCTLLILECPVANQGSTKVVSKTSTKRPSKKRSKLDEKKTGKKTYGICGKDTSLMLFRALGKILYCKRKKYFI